MACSTSPLAVLFLAALAAFCHYAVADKMTWSPCDEGLTSFTPDSVTLSPDPPVIGSAAVFVISGSIDSELKAGTVEMVVSIAGFPIYASSSDLCSKTTCPVPAGPISLTLEELLPPIAPPGDYGLQVIARSSPDGRELACVNVNFSLVMPSSGSAAAKAAADAVASALRQPVWQQRLATLKAATEALKARDGEGPKVADGGGEGQQEQRGAVAAAALYRRSLR